MISRVGRVTAAAVLVLCVLLTSCNDGPPQTRDDPARTTAPPTATSPAPPPEAALPAPAAWTAGAGEVQPEVKLAATAFVEVAGTWTDSAGHGPSVRARLAANGLPADLVDAVEPLTDPDATAATVEVIYPQYGGLTADLASVIVLLRQQLLSPTGATSTRELILDVRLVRGADGWRVTGIAPGTTLGPAQPLSPLAEQVLANDNIRLPQPAGDDIRTGRIDDSVLSVLNEIAINHVVEVMVLHTGHPQNVFETDRQSNHTRGRAVDIWRIDGQLVVHPSTPRELLTDVMTSAGRLGATEVGGPFDLNAERPGYFTDNVHQDHIHIGSTPGRPAATP